MPIYQIYCNNGEEYEEYYNYDILFSDIAVAMNYRPSGGDSMTVLYELLPHSSGYFKTARHWVWCAQEQSWQLSK